MGTQPSAVVCKDGGEMVIYLGPGSSEGERRPRAVSGAARVEANLHGMRTTRPAPGLGKGAPKVSKPDYASRVFVVRLSEVRDEQRTG